jgi:tetratricopeptide (TPR) repeat protein
MATQLMKRTVIVPWVILLIGLTQASALVQEERLAMALTGSVIHQDGSPPLVPTRVVLRCAGRVSQETVTSGAGVFSFDISGDPVPGRVATDVEALVSDPAELENQCLMNTRDFTSCDIRLAGRQEYSANRIKLGRRSPLDDPWVGTIVIRQPVLSVGTTIAVKALLIPEAARMSLERAIQELRAPEPEFGIAARELTKALDLHPRFAVAWQLLGEVRGRMRDPVGARDAFEKAVSMDGSYSKPLLSLARLDLYEEKWEDAATHAQAVLQLNPSCPQALYFSGIANYYSGWLGPAERDFQSLKETGFAKSYPIALFHLGTIHTRRGDRTAAAEEFELYLEWMPRELMPKGQYEWTIHLVAQMKASAEPERKIKLPRRGAGRRR